MTEPVDQRPPADQLPPPEFIIRGLALGLDQVPGPAGPMGVLQTRSATCLMQTPITDVGPLDTLIAGLQALRREMVGLVLAKPSDMPSRNGHGRG